jgi:hypothetical protein
VSAPLLWLLVWVPATVAFGYGIEGVVRLWRWRRAKTARDVRAALRVSAQLREARRW